jgi:hypothetical protein
MKLALFLIPVLACAQQTVAPTTDESTASVRGENAGEYNVVQSWELGYRFATVGGDDGKYRSDVNYGDGVRLLSSYLTVNSRDGRNKWFDELTLTTQGLGGDPYESATLRIQKNRLYRYDMTWRSNDYFNPGLTVANGEHLEDTTFKTQDHELTLLPQNWFRIRAGYNRTTQNGPALTTEQEFDAQGDVFPIFQDVRQEFDEYRLGADVTLKNFRFTVMHRWEYFKEDTTDNVTATLTGTPNPGTLSSFQRSAPYRGRTPAWLGNLYAERKWLAVNGRFTYANGRGDFVQNETAIGTERFGAQNQQIAVTGTGDRPVTTGDVNITIFPSSRLSFINVTSVSDTRMTGNDEFTQFSNATLSAQNLNFQYLGILLITNSTDLRYRVTKKLNFFGGYRYSDRVIKSIEDFATVGNPFGGITAQQSNVLHAGVGGFNWLPVKDLTIHAEAGIGHNNNPFAPISLKNNSLVNTRANYRKKSYSLAGGYQDNYNNNSIAITAYSSHARIWTANGSWHAKPWLSVDASYSKLHLDTEGGLAFFAGASLITNQESLYISNIHSGNLGLRLPVTKRADVYIGYNITKDTGDGRSAELTQPTAAGQLFYNVQTFPLTYQTPLIRLSVRITAKLRYNLGYQYYGYHEEFGLLDDDQNYRAHTGYTSLLWSF